MGLVGAGRVAQKHLRAYRECGDRVELAAVCDVDAAAARAVAGKARVYEDAHRMIREAGIDAVDICTPHAEHAPVALAAAAAGKHVLCQKPLGCSMAECLAVVEAAEQAGVVLMAAMSHRFDPKNQALKQAINQGRIGPVRAIRMRTMMNLPEAVGREHWIYDGKSAGGGVMMCLGLQQVDLARFLVGEVRRVSAVYRRTHPWFRNGAEDVALAILEFAGGAVGELFASFTAAGMEWGESLLVMGETGKLDGAKASDERFTLEMSHFVECCLTGGEPLCGGRENLRTMRAVFAMEAAAREGTVVGERKDEAGT
jgi:predicted dehydrogenase